MEFEIKHEIGQYITIHPQTGADDEVTAIRVQYRFKGKKGRFWSFALLPREGQTVEDAVKTIRDVVNRHYLSTHMKAV